ncbi:restriction endonuclease [Sediminibacterium sp.]|uniref:restriction endonuclease n=1 Tax=Sediminibacterium sp. TaxID=1917865 RepID=UPI0027331F45|nr:restriction endonuclease [Sediminibacterium sp.]MDP3568950.1 restriction endonuclease [Sediminibacterium sp.]
MNASDIPKYDDVLKPTLDSVNTLGGSASVEEIDEKVTEILQLSPEILEAKYPRSGAPIFLDRISWARSYLKIAGLLNNATRGVWVITEAGRDALELSPAELKRRVADAFNEYNLQYQKRKKEKPKAISEANPADVEIYLSTWEHRLLSVLKSMKADAFERLCQRIMRENGFVRIEVTGRPNDGGIDGIGILRMNLVSFQVLFQAKRWSSTVGPSVVRDFRGAMVGRADKGLIITTGAFTSEARKEATRDGAPAIDLVDGESLCQLIKDLKLGIHVRTLEEVEVDKAFFDRV